MNNSQDPLVLVQEFEAPIAVVWEAITNPEPMRSWFFDTIDEFRLEPGFEARFNVHCEGTDYEHVWRLGDYVLWDNRCSAHARTDFPADQRRLLKRGKIAGEKLIAAATA